MHGLLIKKYTLYLILLVSYSCVQGPTEPVYKPVPNVMCVLNPDYEIQRVYAERSYTILEEPSPSDTLWIPSQVKICSDIQEVIFHEIEYRVYGSESLLVESGKTYNLEVTYPNGKKVTGSTTVPQRPRIITPADGDTVNPSQELQWESKEAGGFLLHYKSSWAENMIPETLGPRTSIAIDSLCIKYIKVPPDSVEWLILRIYALDPNYYDYWKRVESNEPIEPGMYLQSAIGVFGACVVSDSISVVIKH